MTNAWMSIHYCTAIFFQKNITLYKLNADLQLLEIHFNIIMLYLMTTKYVSPITEPA